MATELQPGGRFPTHLRVYAVREDELADLDAELHGDGGDGNPPRKRVHLPGNDADEGGLDEGDAKSEQ